MYPGVKSRSTHNCWMLVPPLRGKALREDGAVGDPECGLVGLKGLPSLPMLETGLCMNRKCNG